MEGYVYPIPPSWWQAPYLKRGVLEENPYLKGYTIAGPNNFDARPCVMPMNGAKSPEQYFLSEANKIQNYGLVESTHPELEFQTDFYRQPIWQPGNQGKILQQLQPHRMYK